MTDPAITIELRNMPASRIALSMRWRELLFLHFACDPAEIQKMLPPGLTVDTFPDHSGNEKAWIGLVPFRMEAVHPKGFPHLGGCENFPETNVRTYCHREGKDPGVWFLSLDAANYFACAFASRVFHLNYRHASMQVERRGDAMHYESARCKGEGKNTASCRIGPALGAAKPGTLEFFLIERYLLYSSARGILYKGQVFHPPYQLREANDYSCSGTLLEANGLTPNPFTHAVFSEGVSVSAGRILRVQ